MMKQSTTNFYLPESLWQIMQGEERRGKLREGYYSAGVKEMSAELKQLREQCHRESKEMQATFRQEILELKEQLDETKKEELRQKANSISSGKCAIDITAKTIRGHRAYVTNNIETMLVCQIIKLELRRSYKLCPADMNVIIDQVKGLLDNPMPKVIIRADIQHFFESIPQHTLVQKLIDDGFVSRQTVKYLKWILYDYNIKSLNEQAVGLPRGLAFSSHLSELYMLTIDDKIKRTPGIYYYKRYVDDIIIVADSSKHSCEEYWNLLKQTFEEKQLHLHEDSAKKYIKVLDVNTQEAYFDYLGYRFIYNSGTLRVGLSQKRFDKYKVLVDAIFDIYARCSHYRASKREAHKDDIEKHVKRDALSQLFDRLKILTSNGLLSGRKNYIATGIYYSNKHLTDFSQLDLLDNYLHDKIEDKDCFNPPSNLFNYGEDNGYNKNLTLIKQRLHDFSFKRGYTERKLHKERHFGRVLLDLQHIYHSVIDKAQS